MRFEEKLRKQMLLKGFNQQTLARMSRVSDSEISRILSGKSGNPGLENAFRLAQAVGVSLDYLANDDLDEDPIRATNPEPEKLATAEVGGIEAEILQAAREIGTRQARRVLETVCDLGYEMAIRRLLELKPVIEVGDSPRAVQPPTSSGTDRLASSA